jgi:uncharacterized protein YndB with AHSA1/START domain
MIEIRSQTQIAGLPASFLEDFLLHCDDERYSRWWPGVHLQFHRLSHRAGEVGGRVWMDEYVGRRRLRMAGVVEEFEPGRRIVWRLIAPVPLPVRLRLEYAENGAALQLTHTILAGFPGPGSVLDPMLRLFFDRAFEREMDGHMKTEFRRLKDVFLPEISGGKEK